MGDCLRPIRIWALPRSCSYGPGGGGEGEEEEEEEESLFKADAVN